MASKATAAHDKRQGSAKGRSQSEAIRYERIAFYLLVAFVFLVPVKFGTVNYDTPPQIAPPFPNPILPFDPWPDEFAQMMLILVFLLWMLSSLARRQVTFRFSISAIPLWLFLAVAIISTFRSVVIHSSIVSLKAFISYILFYHLVVNLATDEKRQRTLIWSFIAACVFVGVIGIFQKLYFFKHMAQQIYGSPDLADWQKYYNLIRQGRVSSTFVYPNSLAGFIIIALPLLFAWLVVNRRWLRKDNLWKPVIFVALVIVPIIVSLALSESKGGFLSLGVVAVVGVFIVARLFRLSWKIVVAALIALAIVAAVVAFTPIGKTMIEKGSYTFGERVEYWKAAWKMVPLRPVLGSGLASFNPMYSMFRDPDANDVRTVHNNYLQLLVETGGVGLVFFVAFWVLICVVAVRTFSSRESSGGIPKFTVIITVASFLGILAFLLHNLVDFDLYVRGIAYSAWFLAALITLNSGTSRPRVWRIGNESLATALLIAVTAASLGCVFLTVKTYVGASRYYDAYRIIRNPEDFPDLMNPGETAEDLLESAIHWDGLNHSFYSFLGNVQMQRGIALDSAKDVRTSIATLGRAVELDRYNPAYRLNVVRAEKQLMDMTGRLDKEKLVNLWKDLIEYAPNIPYYRVLFALDLKDLGDIDAAKREYAKAEELDPGLERTLQRLEGKYNEAEIEEMTAKLKELRDGSEQ